MSSISCSQGHQNPNGANFCLVCGESLQRLGALAPLPAGKRLRDRYIIQKGLGEGGFGRTYLVEDTGRFNERLVVKEFVPSAKETAALQKAVELFQREAVTLYQLQHPQIPKFWEVFQAESRLFLVQDFIEGQTYESLLNERLRYGKSFSEAEILELFRDLLPVLNYIHTQGVIHRDVAPDNIILNSKSGLPILIDMGAAKQAAINVTTIQFSSIHRATSIGKTGYAPDEQVRLGIVAPYSDLYALAVTAIVLMTGKQPDQLLDQGTMKWNWERELSLGSIFSQVLNRMLAARPDQRFQSADAVLQILAPVLDTLRNIPPTIISQPSVSVNISNTTLTAPLFFPVSQLKLFVMSIVTFGLYEFFWFYKNWNSIKLREGSKIMPFWRAFFATLFCYPLLKKIKDSANSQGVIVNFDPLLLTIVWIGLTLCWRLPDPYSLVSLLSVLALLPVQKTVNQLNYKVAPNHDLNSRFSGWNIVAIVAVGILFVLAVIGTLFPA